LSLELPFGAYIRLFVYQCDHRLLDSKAKKIIEGIKKDIAPVKNAISFDESSGFVEGNNNKFKLI